jgi:hypothetical protein
MATFNKFNTFVENLAEGKHDFSSNTINAILTTSSPSAYATYTSLFSGGIELASGNGYTQAGKSLTGVTSAQTGGVYKLDANDVNWTASGGDLGGSAATFRYVVIYDNTSLLKELIGYWDYGSSITIADGNTFTVQFDASNGILTIT